MQSITTTIKDLLGNVRETYVHPEAGYKECKIISLSLN